MDMKRDKFYLSAFAYFLSGFFIVVIITINDAIADTPIDGFTVSPNVQDEINKFNPDEVKNVEKAMGIGNRFMQLHFDGNAYQFNPDYASWSTAIELEDILEMSAEQWARDTKNWGGGREKINEGMSGKSGWLVCPNIELYRVDRTEKGFSIFYRTKFVGFMNFKASIGQPESFSNKRSGLSYKVRLDINNGWKIVKVAPDENIVPKKYTWAYWDMSNYARNPTRVPGQTESYVAATAAKFDRLSKELEKAATVCTR